MKKNNKRINALVCLYIIASFSLWEVIKYLYIVAKFTHQLYLPMCDAIINWSGVSGTADINLSDSWCNKHFTPDFFIKYVKIKSLKKNNFVLWGMFPQFYQCQVSSRSSLLDIGFRLRMPWQTVLSCFPPPTNCVSWNFRQPIKWGPSNTEPSGSWLPLDFFTDCT